MRNMVEHLFLFSVYYFLFVYVLKRMKHSIIILIGDLLNR